MKKALVCAAAAVALVFGSGGAAMAGEVNGKGDPIGAPGKAASECVYSGLDTLDSIENAPGSPGYDPMFDDDALAVRGNQKHGFHGVQNYGMFKRAGIDIGINPGMACRGTGG
ncbi:hypothetical protein GCM10022200_15910 [Microbacterium awajiense]|uniref:Secreted protein n=1 Tax=Microbacterium awajiense TaxID=415214 RepID=A0ABP7AIS6_9MICO